MHHLNSFTKIAYLVLVGSVLASNAACDRRAAKPDENAETITAAMLRITQEANANLQQIHRMTSSMNGQNGARHAVTFIQRIQLIYSKGMKCLGDRFNSLPSVSRLQFSGSNEGKMRVARIREEMVRLQGTIFQLSKRVPDTSIAIEVMFPEALLESLQGGEKWQLKQPTTECDAWLAASKNGWMLMEMRER